MKQYSSLYEILKINETATLEEVKTAFRKLALVHHPDKNAGSAESQAAFIMIHQAYTVLSDPEKRKEYDSYLLNSSALKGHRDNRAARPNRGFAITGLAGTPYSSLDTVSSHINYLLWDIEDFLGRTSTSYRNLENGRRSTPIDWNLEITGKPLWYYILKILTFIDKWVLDQGGYPDYFMEARNLTKLDITEYINNVHLRPGGIGHKPFVNIHDYFYNIRKRMDKFLKSMRIGDLVKPIPEHGLRLIDCIFEAQNHTVHYLFFINQALAGETEYIPPFKYSKACFES